MQQQMQVNFSGILHIKISGISNFYVAVVLENMAGYTTQWQKV